MIDLIMLAAPYGVFALLAALVVESPSIDLFKALIQVIAQSSSLITNQIPTRDFVSCDKIKTRPPMRVGLAACVIIINEDLIIEDVSVSLNDYDKIIIINIIYSPNYLINKLLRFFYFYFLSLFLILVTNTKPDTNKITLLYY